ncbi:hypothetical protein [Salinicoccus roseus]|uniref:hypothetical protein n=1 Tax=Salinicoccus roseus TaxID=45670 RepID=UPI002301EE16|nr:hypothetical protein [Salinicoccus roseus]
MKSATSLLNRTLLNHFMGGIFWLTVLFIIGNVLIQPLALWIASSNFEMMGGRRALPENPLDMMIGFQLAGGMLYVLFMVMFLFNYKNREASVDFMHSLPIRRGGLLTHALTAGIINIIVPLAVTAFILFFERYFLAFEISFMQIVEWFFYTLFVLIVVFASAVFLGFLVNSIFVHMQLVIIVFFLPLVFWGLTVAVADMLYDGIVTAPTTGGGGLLSVVTDNTFPIFAVQQAMEGLILWKTIIWSLLAVILIVFSYVIYNRSRNEDIHHTFTNTWVRDILVAFITISGMLLLGLAISFALPRLTLVFILAFIIGAVFSYIVQEMFFQGTAKIQFRKRSLVITAVSIVLFWIFFVFGWQQYTSYVPEEGEVDSVSINAHWASMYGSGGGSADGMSEDYMFISDPKVIGQTLSLHQAAVGQSAPRTNEYDGEALEITYRMKDGDHVNRRYETITLNNTQYDTLLETLNSSSFSTSYDIVYNITDAGDIRNMEISGVNGYVALYSSEEIADFVKDYQRHAPRIDEQIPALVSNTNVPMVNVSVGFELNHYQGRASIYNPAVLDVVEKDQDIADFLGATDSRTMHTISLSNDEKEDFFSDYQTLSFDELNEAYPLEELGDGDRAEVMETLNEGELDAAADQVLLYSPAFMQQFGPEMERNAAADTHYMIGIE